MKAHPRQSLESVEAARFWSRLREAARSVLMLDYDGTLAPFKNDRLQAFPYPGVEKRLSRLSNLPNVRLVLVSGRPAQELDELLASRNGREMKLEIWGNHGREHLKVNGDYQLFPLEEGESKAIELVRQEMTRLGFRESLEVKPASVAVHWRKFGPEARDRIRLAIESIVASCSDLSAGKGNLELLPFDGGLELRSKSRTKGTVVKEILAEEEPGIPVAYLGDDFTDEDAFAELEGHGISILVSSGPRESSASFWIKPPQDLLQFLDQWIRSAGAQTDSGGGPPDLQTIQTSTGREDGGR